jgi:hypothetical protein
LSHIQKYKDLSNQDNTFWLINIIQHLTTIWHILINLSTKHRDTYLLLK